MIKQASIVLYSWLQPSQKALESLVEFVCKWNAAHSTKWVAKDDNYVIEFENINRSDFKEIKQQLENQKEKYEVDFDLIITKIYENDDFQNADMILIDGFNLQDYVYQQSIDQNKNNYFVKNFHSNIKPSKKCPGCGASYPYSGEQYGPFIIDEYFIDHKYDSGAGKWRKKDDSWDFISIPGGFLFISDRVLNLLRENDIKGYEIIEVISFRTNEKSNRLFQLSPTRLAKQVCIEHSGIIDGICPECGRILVEREGELYFRKEWIGDDEIVIRRPGGLRIIYFNHRVYNLLKSMQLKEMIPIEPAYVCQHNI